jgi:hypothetical protein
MSELAEFAQELDCTLDDLGRESGGTFCVVLIDRAEACRLIEAALTGATDRLFIVAAVDDFIQQIRAASRRRAPRCALCSKPFGPGKLPAVIAVIAGYIDAPSTGVLSGFCKFCARRSGWPVGDWRRDLGAALLPALRHIWPDARMAEPMQLCRDMPGRA